MKILRHGHVQVSFSFNIVHNAYHDHLFVGRIICRFEGKFSDSHSNMRALGDYLRQQQMTAYQPYFTVKDDIDDPDRIQASGCNSRGTIAPSH